MDFSTSLLIWTICLSVTVILFAASLIIIPLVVIKPYLDKRNEINERNSITDQRKLYMDMNPNEMNETVNEYIEGYIDKYIVYKFISKKVVYINQDAIDEMVRDLTKLIVIDISELYIFYIQMTRNISNDEELITAIHDIIMSISVEKVSSFNGTLDQ